MHKYVVYKLCNTIIYNVIKCIFTQNDPVHTHSISMVKYIYIYIFVYFYFHTIPFNYTIQAIYNHCQLPKIHDIYIIE